MSTISRVTTWSDGQALTASALNGEINNILNDYNGSIANANISASAAISSSKLSGVSTPSSTDSFTNKTITDSTNNVMAKSLKSATTTVDVSAATAPSANQVLTATNSTTATWQDRVGVTSKTFSFTRDVSAANGNVSITGIGFTPTSLRVSYGGISSNNTWGVGQSDSAKSANATMQSSASISDIADVLIYVSPLGGTNAQATIASYDADGFTLTWAKTGSPTGTLTIKGVAYK